ncbi:MAG: DUF2927 domain-containing protein [Pseudomonadota bacterium]
MAQTAVKVALVAATLALSSCIMPGDTAQPDDPRDLVLASPRPVPNPLLLSLPVRDVPLATTEELTKQYDRFEARLVSQGSLRTDRGSLASLTANDLATNFIRIALYDEYSPVDGQFVAQETTSRLRRWEAPVELELRFGASVSEAQQDRDHATVESLVMEVATASGHPVSVTDEDGNFTVFVVNETERLALRPDLLAIVPGMDRAILNTVLDILPSTLCLAVAFSDPQTPHVYRRVIALIRAEHPEILRTACFHEEVAQGLGLANDSRAARPSIFNDDEEFALLTVQDALMLQMLYDDRLQPSMDVATAEPLVREIAEELLGPQLASAEPEVLDLRE